MEGKNKDNQQDNTHLKEFKIRISNYYKTLELTEGMGIRGQFTIDKEYERLLESYHSLNDKQKEQVILPDKWICRNDGYNGITNALTNLACDIHRNQDTKDVSPCSIQ